MAMKRLVALFAAGLLLPLLAACGQVSSEASSGAPNPAQTIGDQPTGGADLSGTSWVLTGRPFASGDPSGSGITLEFADTELSGSAGVNQYFGGFTSSTDGSLEIGVLGSTEMAGDEAAMALEQEYLTALQSIFGYTIVDGTLTLVGAADQVLTYSAA